MLRTGEENNMKIYFENEKEREIIIGRCCCSPDLFKEGKCNDITCNVCWDKDIELLLLDDYISDIAATSTMEKYHNLKNDIKELIHKIREVAYSNLVEALTENFPDEKVKAAKESGVSKDDMITCAAVTHKVCLWVADNIEGVLKKGN